VIPHTILTLVDGRVYQRHGPNCPFLDVLCSAEPPNWVDQCERDTPEVIGSKQLVATIKPVICFAIKFKERWGNKSSDLQGRNQVVIEVTRLQGGSELLNLLNRFVDVLVGTSTNPPHEAYRIAAVPDPC
jgi:hypothetical protein